VPVQVIVLADVNLMIRDISCESFFDGLFLFHATSHNK
jgi:hypothetical protein